MDNVAKEMEHLHKLAVANPEQRFQKLWENLISEKSDSTGLSGKITIY
jgi:hypothetical protein